MDLFDKCNCYTAAREAIEGGYYPYFIPLTENEGTIARFRGRELIMCGSNNYLGLTTHPDVKRAAAEALERFGTSCTGSRFLNGNLELHEQLEAELAAWVDKPAALVFSTGMQTNMGTISALVGRDDVVFLDKEDHASIVDGARLCMGRTQRFRHNNVSELESALAATVPGKGKMVVVDGVYSMEGDMAPLPELTRVCQKYGARLMVDDAHSIGVLGGGRGTAAHFGLTGQVDLIMGTFSKSLASLGGFIAGDDTVVHFIKHHARALIFSASITPVNAASALAALRVMRQEPDRIERLTENANRMRRGFHDMGLNTGASATPIVPIITGDTPRTMLAWRLLFEHGVFVNAIIPPAVPEGRQMLRTSYMATHTGQQLDRVLEIVADISRRTGLVRASGLPQDQPCNTL